MTTDIGNSKLAVVVEDEGFIRMQIADVLAGDGWETVEFSDGTVAIAYLGSGRKVELLVTDIRLPGATTGWDVALSYRNAHPAVRVIYCSGNAADEAKRVQGGVFLPKPCNMDKLLEAARKGR